MTSRSDEFVKAWVSRNVHPVPGLEDYGSHVADLAAQLSDDANAAGIGEDELTQTVGDIDNFMTNEYEQIQDTTLGFHESGD